MAHCFYCMTANEGRLCETCERQPDAPHHLKPGSMLNGRYLVGVVLGEGGFGITYFGRDTKLNMKVAIKEYYPSGMVNRNTVSSSDITANMGSSEAAFEKGKKNFLEEARTLAKFFNEQNVVTVVDFFEANNTAYIVMDYLEGEDLKSYFEKNKIVALTFDEAFSMLSPIMSVLTKIHDKGLIHRDISPANIMILDDGTIKLLDFGAARDFSGADEKSLSVMLKPGYAPEEQYRSKGNQGPWTDVYALSATLYKMVTGVTPDDSMNRLFADEVVRPSELNSQITQEQSDVILKGMAIFQKDRYQSMKEFQEACMACLDAKSEKSKVSNVQPHVLDEEKTIFEMPSSNSDTEKTVFEVPVVGESKDTEPQIHNPVSVLRPKAKHESVVEHIEKPKTMHEVKKQVLVEDKLEKKPKLGGFIGSIALGIIALFMVVTLIGGMGDPWAETSDHITDGIFTLIFAAGAAGCGYFYYPRIDNKNRRPNRLCFIVSNISLVISAIWAIIGFSAFGSDYAGAGAAESAIGFAVGFVLLAVYFGYFYYPRLEKKIRNKHFKIYGSIFASIVVVFVAYTVFFTLNTITIGDEEIKKNAETVELAADLLTDNDIEKLCELKNLKELSIQACFLDDADVKIIGQMTQLEKLRLTGNVDIKDISPLGNLTNLVFLDLEMTGTEDISCFEKLTKLTQLSISDTKVKDVSVIEKLTLLETFYMNNLENLDQTTIKLPNQLMYFYCNNNGLTNVEFLKDLMALSTVELSNNALTDLSSLSSKPLHTVKVNDNQITDLAPVSTVSLELRASNNQIADVSCLKGCKAKFVYLDHNKITDISAFKDNSRIGTLDLSNNNISDISSLKDCFNIYSLKLDHNSIKDISSLATIDSLDILDLSFNQIADISPLKENQNYIQTNSAIYLQNNQIVDVSPLSSFKNCDSIWLDNNLIEDISPLSSCTKLERLTIKNNLISDLSVLGGMTYLNRVFAVGNPVTKVEGLNLVDEWKSDISGETYSSDCMLGGSILSISYTEQIDWQQVSNMNIDDIRVYDIPPRKMSELEDWGYRTNYDSTKVEEEVDE